ncbi:tRNA-modifying protein YgfZ [Aliidiomarina haloalkalitolerans]|uniref:tRNA-modifying protein YgfZ n=1 Tax=Aliidiomarina haloalkalitolerans TaxID=859059 RepID=UPI0013002ACE|nr:tRNA-modifying protein YgfZ [Aliidiomarina haloalkalitolerans]
MSKFLPDLVQNASPSTAVEIEGFGLIHVAGPDADKFLQGQLTCDLNELKQDNWLFGGHCDAKGKLWSVFRALRSEHGVYLLQPTSTIAASLAQLQKFGVFSKVEITDASSLHRYILVLGQDAEEQVSAMTGIEPSQQHEQVQDIHVLQVAEHAYLLVLPASFKVQGQLNHQSWWQALHIEQGWPWLGTEHQGEFVPQMVNLDKIGGINFKKGCYIGQETVARMHYKGQNKRRLMRLEGHTDSLPTASDQLEVQIGENWRRAGAVISAVRYDNEVVAIQAVLPDELEQTAKLRIKGQESSSFTPCSHTDENGTK